VGKRKKREVGEKWAREWRKRGKLANKAIKFPSPMEGHKK